jgi:hypothetical protein
MTDLTYEGVMEVKKKLDVLSMPQPDFTKCRRCGRPVSIVKICGMYLTLYGVCLTCDKEMLIKEFGTLPEELKELTNDRGTIW